LLPLAGNMLEALAPDDGPAALEDSTDAVPELDDEDDDGGALHEEPTTTRTRRAR